VVAFFESLAVEMCSFVQISRPFEQSQHSGSRNEPAQGSAYPSSGRVKGFVWMNSFQVHFLTSTGRGLRNRSGKLAARKKPRQNDLTLSST
jgi:hypothetical protein